MMPLARKPSKASFPRAMQATVRRFKARLQARQDKAASTSRLGCRHAQWGKGVFRTPKRSTLHKPAQHAPSAIAARCIAHRTALRFPTECGAAGRPSPLPFSLQPQARLAASGAKVKASRCPSPQKVLPLPIQNSTNGKRQMISKARIKLIHALEMRKHRLREGLFVAEGPRLVNEMLHSVAPAYLAATPEWLAANGHLMPKGCPTDEVSDQELRQASLLRAPQQVLALFPLPEYRLDASLPQENLCLALDGVQDPGNMGTIVRIADWFGIADIICSHETVDVFNPKAVQATMGALARVRVHYTDLPEFIRQSGAPTWGTLLDGQDIYSQPLDSNGLIIMGNEGNGISAQVRPLVTHRLLIPSFPPDRPTTDSLNVAIATSIVCAEFRRRQQ